MKYRRLGRSGLRVSSLCLGTMGFMDGLPWGTDRDQSRRVFDAFVDHGGNFIDTANTYGDGASEAFLGEFMGAARHRLVVATKYTGKYTVGERNADPNVAGSHRKSLIQAIEGSLRRLRTDYVDVLYVHSWDFLTPVDELLRALDDVVRSGKVLYLGVSNAPAWLVAHANTLADARGWLPFVTMQIEYNLLERDPDRELIPMARALEIGLTAWTPLASGWLTGKYLRRERKGADAFRLDDEIMGRFVTRDERTTSIAQQVVDIAGELGCQPAHVALNWVRQHDAIPIFGARSAEQVHENAECFSVNLTTEHMRRLDDVSRIGLGYPHDFLSNAVVKQFVYGGMLDAIENPPSLMPF